MKRTGLLLAFLVEIIVTGCAAPPGLPAAAPAATPTSIAAEEAAVRAVVEQFGQRLRLVSLLAPDAAKQMEEQYADLVASSLLDTWMKNVVRAPGRMVSSPWPERIAIQGLTKDDSGRYLVDGFVLEVTSEELAQGGVAARLPVRIVVEQRQGKWVITGFRQR